jgi:hypothetical protein
MIAIESILALCDSAGTHSGQVTTTDRVSKKSFKSRRRWAMGKQSMGELNQLGRSTVLSTIRRGAN